MSESKEVSKNLMCVVIRGGLELWIDENNLDAVKMAMEKKSIIEINRSIINGVDITGIFEAAEMEDRTRRKNGQWKDDDGNWHNKGENLCSRGCGQVIPWGMTCGNHGSR